MNKELLGELGETVINIYKRICPETKAMPAWKAGELSEYASGDMREALGMLEEIFTQIPWEASGGATSMQVEVSLKGAANIIKAALQAKGYEVSVKKCSGAGYYHKGEDYYRLMIGVTTSKFSDKKFPKKTSDRKVSEKKFPNKKKDNTNGKP